MDGGPSLPFALGDRIHRPLTRWVALDDKRVAFGAATDTEEALRSYASGLQVCPMLTMGYSLRAVLTMGSSYYGLLSMGHLLWLDLLWLYLPWLYSPWFYLPWRYLLWRYLPWRCLL